MPSIDQKAILQTVITTFEMTPGTCDDLLDELRDAYATFISRQPGSSAPRSTSTTRGRGSPTIPNGSGARISRPCCGRPRCGSGTGGSARCATGSSP
jgi:hypothetical protein